MKVGFSYSVIASIIGYRSDFNDKASETSFPKKISSVKNSSHTCLTKAKGKNTLLELRATEHDINKRISKNAGYKIQNYLQSAHNPANEKGVRFVV